MRVIPPAPPLRQHRRRDPSRNSVGRNRKIGSYNYLCGSCHIQGGSNASGTGQGKRRERMGSPILPKRRAPHPRLLANAADWPRLRRQIEDDAVSGMLWSALTRRAKGLLDLAPLARTMSGRRLLFVSRQALERISVLSLVAKVSGDTRYVRRARVEMLAVAAFEDWNPAHFLDVAEMSLAMAIGYDWLFDDLSAGDREAIEVALIGHGLSPSFDAAASHNWWQGATENWAQVCHGGLCAAAIAVADRVPGLAEQILQRALDQVPAAAAAYAPDGVYPEGPMYWGYGTSYHVVLCAALMRLTGDCRGLDAGPGFAAGAEALGHLTAPSGGFFNFGDCREQRHLQVPMFWMARRFGRPDWVRHDLTTLADELAIYDLDPTAGHGHYDMLALALLWHVPATATSSALPPGSWTGQGRVPVAVLRSASLYVAVKGGIASTSHAHMDAGCFILEAHGVRWAVDPGMQDYEGLEQAGLDLWNQEQQSQRWEVFRIGPDAHNILRFDDAPQRVDGAATIVAFDARAAQTILDLGAVYAWSATRVQRGIRLIDDQAVLFQDEWTAANARRVVWQFLTKAEVTVAGRQIRLDQDGQSLLLRVLDPAEIEITVSDVSAPRRAYDAANPGLRAISINCAGSAGMLRVVALPNGADARPVTLALADW
ncbi:MAG: heparinase II/III family protein [Devosia sp.]|nr:heparinase II/III family protein [Devosia sp.]